uniref:C-type lectin domain-containing protein n=1 Tax=Mesocestoides corti TaxID=53468 RepID=A0A5K3F1N9_MESCO
MGTILLILLTVFEIVKGTESYAANFPCADSSWSYVPESGKCYKLSSNNLRYNWTIGQDICSKMLQRFPNVSVSIAETRDVLESEELKGFLVGRAIKEKIWLNAVRTSVSDPFVWKSDNKIVNLDFISWSGGTGVGNCLVFFYTTHRVQTQWITKAVVEDYPCSSTFALVCEHTVKDCENPPGGFDPTKMEFKPTGPHVGTVTTIACSPGFFPQPSTTPPVTSGVNVDRSLAPGQYRCDGQRDESGDPSLITTHFAYSGTALPDCIAIRCSEEEMKGMVPKFGKLSSARSKLTEEEYGSLQVNQFNQYGNVVTYICDESYFFPDHSFEKHVECTLKEGSNNKGVWKGYSGTILPLAEQCEPVTCMYEKALIKSSHNIQPLFTIDYSNGTMDVTEKLKPIPYPYRTKIRYTCMAGYETVTKEPDQNISCGSIGRWRPQLSGCIKKTENIITSSTGRFIPPAVEAMSARQLGTIVIIIIVIFLLSLLLLDLTTLRRDIAWFFNNIRLQKRLWLAKRRLYRAKREAKQKRNE